MYCIETLNKRSGSVIPMRSTSQQGSHIGSDNWGPICFLDREQQKILRLSLKEKTEKEDHQTTQLSV